MNTESLGSIFLNAALVNNFVLAYFLGICPFWGYREKWKRPPKWGSCNVCYVDQFHERIRYSCILVRIDAPFLQLISYIVVIASTVQLVEMFIKKISPALFKSLGIFLPSITTNCAILGVALFQTNKGYGF